MALTGPYNSPSLGLGTPTSTSYPVLTGVTIYEGAIVVINSSGYAKPGVSEASDICVGRANATVVAGAAASGTFQIPVMQGAFRYSTHGTAFTIADVGKLAYVYDDSTVTKDATSASIAGTIYDVTDSGLAYVLMQLAPAVDGTSLAATNSSVSTLQNATLGLGLAPQALSGAGAVNVTALVTLFTSTGAAQALTLANGTQTGQLKIVHHTVDGGSGVLTPATAGNFATITFTNIHEWAMLQWSGTAWNVIGSSPLTIIA